VQVFHDLLGLFDAFIPKHTRRFAEAGALMREALSDYVEQVKAGTFPTAENSFNIKPDVLKALQAGHSDADR
jgi:3-methyl-2-oxobutanoate hydroxymethyltransferase